MSGGFGGILPAVVTPFDEDGRFRPAVLERLLERLYGAGVHGVYVNGTTGEGIQQPAAQRMAVAEAAVRNSPRGAQVIVHVGAAALEDAVGLARHAGRIGASAVSSLPPVGGFSFPEIRAYYAALADAAQLPLFLYYYPDIVPSAVLSPDQLLELCSLPGVAGLKLTDYDLYRLWVLKQDGVTVLNGRDEVLVAGLLMGADGAVGSFYNLLPREALRVFDGAREGEWAAARAAQERINALVRVVADFPLLPAVKQILRWSGLDCGDCLPPRAPLDGDQGRRLRQSIERAGLADALFGEGGAHA